MSECTCHKNYTLDTLIPKVGIITDIRQETPDVKTFRVNAPDGGKLFEHRRRMRYGVLLLQESMLLHLWQDLAAESRMRLLPAVSASLFLSSCNLHR